MRHRSGKTRCPAIQNTRFAPAYGSLVMTCHAVTGHGHATRTDATTLKLCRLHYAGSAHQWQFAIYRASHDD
jgi:hypothetical protein